jgi:hypothetical protein
MLSALNPIKQTFLRATTGQCGLDSAYCHSATVRDVAKLDHLGGGGREGGSREATLFCAATLHHYGLPVDFARLAVETLPEMCACYKASLWDPAISGTKMENFSPSSITWEGVGEMEGALKELSRSMCFLIQIREGQYSWLLVFSSNLPISARTIPDRGTF